jgi:hypothetical protein
MLTGKTDWRTVSRINWANSARLRLATLRRTATQDPPHLVAPGRDTPNFIQSLLTQLSLAVLLVAQKL